MLLRLLFNSIKVRLRRTYTVAVLGMTAFQFHKGAIETSVVPSGVIRLLLFQFHKGAIETRCMCCCRRPCRFSIP